MEPSKDPSVEEPNSRRYFLNSVASVVIGALISLTPLFAGIAFLLDPILKRRPRFRGGDAEGFIPIAKLSELSDDGTPQRFVLRADKLDAWNLFKNQTIGTVYVRKMPGDKLLAFNDTCPHLGCKVEFQENQKCFLCPCHASAFSLDGEPTNKIPPRPLDRLAYKTENGEIWIKYQDFQSGKEKQEVVE